MRSKPGKCGGMAFEHGIRGWCEQRVRKEEDETQGNGYRDGGEKGSRWANTHG